MVDQTKGAHGVLQKLIFRELCEFRVSSYSCLTAVVGEEIKQT